MKNLLLGALIGAGVALLYAPATGSATRSRLRDKANKLASDTTDFVDKKRIHLANKIEGYKHTMHRAADDLRSRYASDVEPMGVGR